jgi:hypothetical protein
MTIPLNLYQSPKSVPVRSPVHKVATYGVLNLAETIANGLKISPSDAIE